MPKSSNDLVVDAYIEQQAKEAQPALGKLRALIRKAVPEAEEVISYKMPTYKLHGRTVIHFAGWTEHVAIYPGAGDVVDALREELAPYDVSKGTIRFPLADKLPIKLIERIVKLRAQQVAEAQQTKVPRKRPLARKRGAK